MTYNIHSGVNPDGKVRLQPAVQVIQSLDPDIVALQEVDMGITHRRYRHQAKVLSERLEMEFFFFHWCNSRPAIMAWPFCRVAHLRWSNAIDCRPSCRGSGFKSAARSGFD